MTASPAHPSSIRGLLPLALALMLVQACESGDTREGDTSLAGDTAGDPTSDASDSQNAECDRFCTFDLWLEARRGSTYVGCMCQTTMLDVTVVDQGMIDRCIAREDQSINGQRNPVETDCVEALTEEQLQEVIELTTCYFERTAQVSPCLRAMQAGDLCSTCEQFSNPDQRFPCTSRAETSDRIASCVDGRPGFL
jgi:hypothetical protein